MNPSCYEWYYTFYNRLRPYATFGRAMFGLHSDFRQVGERIPSPDNLLFVVPMANVCYADPDRGRVVSFDVRNARDEFVHHIQTGIPTSDSWAIGWQDSETVIVKGIKSQPVAFIVGTCSLYYKVLEPFGHDLIRAIDSLTLPRGQVKPTLNCRRKIHNNGPKPRG